MKLTHASDRAATRAGRSELAVTGLSPTRTRHNPFWLGKGAFFPASSIHSNGIHLLAGPPGSRKSGLALQLALDRGTAGSGSLILLSEESRARVTERAFRMLVGGGGAANQRALAHVALEEASADPLLLSRQLEHLVLRPDAKHRGVDGPRCRPRCAVQDGPSAVGACATEFWILGGGAYAK